MSLSYFPSWIIFCCIIIKSNQPILPYITVTVMRDSLCWKEKTVEFEVGNQNVDNLQFLQTGYILKCTISHPVKLVRNYQCSQYWSMSCNNKKKKILIYVLFCDSQIIVQETSIWKKDMLQYFGVDMSAKLVKVLRLWFETLCWQSECFLMWARLEDDLRLCTTN